VHIQKLSDIWQLWLTLKLNDLHSIHNRIFPKSVTTSSIILKHMGHIDGHFVPTNVPQKGRHGFKNIKLDISFKYGSNGKRNLTITLKYFHMNAVLRGYMSFKTCISSSISILLH